MTDLVTTKFDDLSVQEGPSNKSIHDLIDLLSHNALKVDMPSQSLQFIRSRGIALRDPAGNIIREEVQENGHIPPAKRTRGHRR